MSTYCVVHRGPIETSKEEDFKVSGCKIDMIYITYSACVMPSLKNPPAIEIRNSQRKSHIRGNPPRNV